MAEKIDEVELSLRRSLHEASKQALNEENEGNERLAARWWRIAGAVALLLAVWTGTQVNLY